MHYRQNIDIDIEASKKESKVVFIKNYASFGFWFDFIAGDFFIFLVVVLFFPSLSIRKLLDNLGNPYGLFISLFFVLLTISLAAIVVYGTFSPRKLIRIHGISPHKNHAIIKEIIEELDWYLYRDSGTMALYRSKWTWLSSNFGRELIVIFDEKDVLINCITMSKYKDRSPFHWSGNQRIEKKFQEAFSNKLKNTESP